LKASIEKSLPGITIPEGMPFSKLEKILPEIAKYRQGIDTAKENSVYKQALQEDIMSRQGTRIAEGKNKELRTAVRTERDKIYKDSKVEEIDKSLTKAQNAKRLLEGQTPQAIGLALSQLSKGIGAEVGVLTEQDIKRVEGSIGFPGMMMDVQKFFSGNYTEGQQANWKQLIDGVEKALAVIKEGRIRDRAKGFAVANKDLVNSSNYEGDLEQNMLETFGIKGTNAATSPTTNDLVTVVAPTGEERQMSREESKKWIAKGGKVKGE